jgi:hypothetical protein
MEDLESGVNSIIIPFLSLIMRLFLVLVSLVTMVYLARFGSRADAVVAKHLAFLIELAGGTLHNDYFSCPLSSSSSETNWVK